MTTAAIRSGSYVIDRHVKLAQQALCYRCELFARRGRRNLPGRSLEKLQANVSFQLLYRQGYRWLRSRQLFCRAVEAAVACNYGESPQMVQGDIVVLDNSRPLSVVAGKSKIDKFVL